MYQFSRSIYRELAPLVVDDRYGASGTPRQHGPRSRARAAFERLATDRHYFARPTRTLFNDVRVVLPDDAPAATSTA